MGAFEGIADINPTHSKSLGDEATDGFVAQSDEQRSPVEDHWTPDWTCRDIGDLTRNTSNAGSPIQHDDFWDTRTVDGDMFTSRSPQFRLPVMLTHGNRRKSVS